jgi:hypothetical protein
VVHLPTTVEHVVLFFVNIDGILTDIYIYIYIYIYIWRYILDI